MKLIPRRLFRRIRRFFLGDIALRTEVNSLLLGQLHIHRIRQLRQVDSLKDVEFKVFSQWGEDGIIQYLVAKVPIANRTFVEFGVERYLESNTRFLLVNDNWKGLVIDASRDDIAYIKNDEVSLKYDLTAVCRFISRENINEVISSAGLAGDVGLLSIDIDGNDYWVWEAINIISPCIVICEYNSVFGSRHAISVPYDQKFHRTRAHYSNLYFGASLPALCVLAERKGYDFVGANSAGVNAFFVRKDLSHGLPKLGAEAGYVFSHIRESKDVHGNLTHVSGLERLNVIKHLQVADVTSGQLVTLADLIGDRSRT